jgi:ABC-type transport system substrate-binding protein
MLGAATAHGQPLLNSQGRATAQSLVIGLLSGKTDYRDIALTTPEGMFRVYGQGNSKPFEMIDGNPERLVISFKNHAPASVDRGRPQRIIYQFFKTERSLISAIILDEVDYAIFESEASVAEIEKSTRKYRLLPRPANPNAVEMVCYNAGHPLLRDRTVRQALAYAIRRNEIKRRFPATRADVAKGSFPKDSQFFPPDINEYSYNPKSH